ncbi:MAG: MATE family efflux transporter [Lachnospiraceae bacterium]|nr:MATE family efflux transporter [Lachnospiraceae bacterium]
MLHGSLADKLILFALPLALSSILQQLFNSADVAVVGRFAGSQALAAVGANVANVGVFVNLLVGMSVGPNVVIARLIGQGKEEEVSRAVRTVIAMALFIGVGLMVLGWCIAGPLLEMTNTPDEVLAGAKLYFRIYIIGVPFITLFDFGTAILRSVGDTKRPMYVMLISGIVNVLLNLFFVIICHMSVSGVALATLISNILSAGLILYLLTKEESSIRWQMGSLALDLGYVKKVLQVGIPSGFQGMIFSLSNIFIQSGINSFGASTVAASSVALNFEYFAYAVSSAFAQGAVTFVSQNFGAKQMERCRKIYWLALAEGMGCTALLSLVFTVKAHWFAGIYTTEQEVVEIAVIRMLHVMSLEALTVTYEVTAGTLRSIGYQLIPAVFTVLGTVGLRILWMYTVFRRVPTFEMLMNVYPVSWVFTGATLMSAYFILWRRMMNRQN